MKMLYFSMVVATISIYLFTTSFFHFNSEFEQRGRIEAYKRKFAVACSPNTDYENYNYYSLPRTFGIYWARYNPPFTESVDTGYNNLFIPDTLSGKFFNLRIHDSAVQYFPGAATVTAAYNNNKILGPTLIMRRGDTVAVHFENDLSDSTTVHWHGIHLPAIMDGGPHQFILPYGGTWDPTWVVDNNASTHWYHPHLHMKTARQLVQGLAGLIIVRDSREAALNLPRQYGVDDIPLVLNEKRFDPVTNQLVVAPYGDTMMCNGTLHAQYTVPSQIIRFRVLDGATERCYNLGFSDNRTFYVIGGDAGLLQTPVPVTRYLISSGERIEILADFSGQQGQNIKLMAYNSKLSKDIPGSEPDNDKTLNAIRNKLGARDFEILSLNVGPQTEAPVTAIPSSLCSYGEIDSTQATVTRTIKITSAGAACSSTATGCSWFNGQFYDPNRIDYKVQKDATEIWQITNSTSRAHPFHIHDVNFKILSRSGGPVPDYEKGWKDVVLVRKGETVRFAAKFKDYADSLNPYMYHCHISFHEDDGMMGQFVVLPPPSVAAIAIKDASITEGNSGTSQMKFTVALNSVWGDTIKVNYATANGTAKAGPDYVAINGVLVFNPGEAIKTITVDIIGDTLVEKNETFKVNLSQPVNAVFSDSSAKATIRNDDVATALIALNAAATEITTTSGRLSIYPNPVSGSAQISYTVDALHKTSLNVYDNTGKLVKTLVSAGQAPGTYQLAWDAKSNNGDPLSAGIYFLKFDCGTYRETRKLVLVK